MLIICVSSSAGNVKRRRAIRRSWFGPAGQSALLTEEQRASVQLFFVVSAGSADLQAEQDEHGDMLLVDAAEGYEHLWRKAMVSMKVLEERFQYSYYMHADDDSYVRLDLILQLLADSPTHRFYWGYIWDGTGNRCTAPIRNRNNKSHMPEEQYALDYYPPFASGCGFILSRDLVQALLKQPLPDYRLLDPPFGIHLCGRDFCVLPDGPVVPVHDERVRPYRGIPVFKPSTVVQHYLMPEEMAPFHCQVLEHLSQAHVEQSQPSAPTSSAQPPTAISGSSGKGDEDATTAADDLYSQLVQLGLLRR